MGLSIQQKLTGILEEVRHYIEELEDENRRLHIRGSVLRQDNEALRKKNDILEANLEVATNGRYGPPE